MATDEKRPGRERPEIDSAAEEADPLGLNTRPEPAKAAAPGKPGAAEKSSAVSAETPAAPVKTRGRVLGVLGFLMGLAGLAGAGYLYYLLVYQEPQTAVDARLQSLEAQLQASSRELEALSRDQRQALTEFAAEQARERDASAERLLEAMNQLATQAPPSRREWKVAEVSYLLRIANHRLLMERDVAGALMLLRGADVILQELDDFALYQVRAQLADEILSLENVESNDVQGLFLRLEAIKTELRQQSAKLPRFKEDPATSVAEDQGFWDALVEQLGSYLRFRRFDGAAGKPLLAPEEAVYLELNLRLMLERAQLAALRREQVVYEQSLQTAADWIETYLDLEDPELQRSLEELSSLSKVQLDLSLPDISGSLGTLKLLGEA